MSTSLLSRSVGADIGVGPDVAALFEPRTCSIQYVVADPITRVCALIDPVLDYDERSGSIGTGSADALLCYVAEQKLQVGWILDTHPHADHLSAAAYLSDKTSAPMGISAFPTRHACSSVTTICQAGALLLGRARSQNRRRAISTFEPRITRTSSWPCARRAIASSPCRS